MSGHKSVCTALLPLTTNYTTDIKRVVCQQHCKEGVVTTGEDEIMLGSCKCYDLMCLCQRS